MAQSISANPYREEMKNIRYKIAMQSIRKVVRDQNCNDIAKLNIIMAIVHDFEDDQESAEIEEERKAIEAEEAEMRRENVDDLFTDMAAPLDELKVRKEGK